MMEKRKFLSYFIFISLLFVVPIVLAQANTAASFWSSFWDTVISTLAKITKIEPEYFSLENVLPMVIIPLAIIISMTQAALQYTSRKFSIGFLKSEESKYVIWIISISTGIASMSYGAGYIISGIVLPLMSSIGIIGILLLGGGCLIALNAVRILFWSYKSLPKNKTKLIEEHRKAEDNITNLISYLTRQMNNNLNSNRAAYTTTGDVNKIEGHINTLMSIGSNIETKNHDIRNSAIAELLDQKAISDRSKLVNAMEAILKRIEQIPRMKKDSNVTTSINNLRIWINHIGKLEKELQELLEKVRIAEKNAQTSSNKPATGTPTP